MRQTWPMSEDIEGGHGVSQVSFEAVPQPMVHISLVRHTTDIMEKTVSTIIRTFHWPRQQLLTLAGSPLAR